MLERRGLYIRFGDAEVAGNQVLFDKPQQNTKFLERSHLTSTVFYKVNEVDRPRFQA